MVEVPDQRLQDLAKIVNPERILPAVVEFVDIAGLVAGASKGEGLGNQFLANIRETDATVHVVRCFADDNVIHVAGKVDPWLTSKSSTPNWRWLIWAWLKKAVHRNQKLARSGDKDAAKLVALLERIEKRWAKASPCVR